MGREEELSSIKGKVIADIKKLGQSLGLKDYEEWGINGGSVDLVLYVENKTIPSLPEKIPLIGFEIETSWRTRKHIKGDIMNLQILKSSIGILVLCKEGFKTKNEYDGLLKFTKELIKTLGLENIYVWSDEDLRKFTS